MSVSKQMGETAEDFSDAGCCLIRNILSKDLCDYLSAQMEIDTSRYQKFNACPQAAGAVDLYNTVSAQIAQNILLIKIKNFLKLNKIFSTYAYCRKYYKFQKLLTHIDRIECEISLSVCLSMADKTNPWSFYCRNSDQNIVYNGTPNVGDGILYLGAKLEHWREECEQNWIRQAFFHYSSDRELEFDPTRQTDHDPQQDLIKIICENL